MTPRRHLARAVVALVGVLVAILLIWGTAALVVPALAASRGPTPPSPVIFPQQVIPISFSHAEHLSKEKLDCAFCHDSAESSTSSSDRMLPGHAECSICHELDEKEPNKEVAAGKPDAKCVSCHPGWTGTGAPAKIVLPAPNLKFNHKLHVGKKIRCQECHGDLLKEEVGLATRLQLPKMKLCLGCHDGRTAKQTCTTCHKGQPSGRLVTEFAEGDLAPTGQIHGDAHDASFRTQHARVGRDKAKYCESCHAKDFCTGCHDGVAKPLDFHGGDYVTTHPIEARRNNPDCSSCHRRQTFCVGCHNRLGVTAREETTAFSTGGDGCQPGERCFHPQGNFGGFRGVSLDGRPGDPIRSGSHHSFQAQRNIRACASCHEEDFCVGCHGSTTRNTPSPVNPHPRGWATSAKCRALSAKNGRMCLKCHIDPNEARCL